ncbi:gamma carbonic anhydrase family protein [Cohnella yongneupensis]|uniref:Gamma carbonic anhydrase family protein n=1 Tax=Cohnella yongneupensis TaxID=425006 RepID=A0ABW0R6D8_9BACL
MQYPLNGHTPRVDPSAYVAPGAHIIGQVTIGKRSSVWFNCVLRGDSDTIDIGAGVNIQDGTICHIDEGVPLRVADDVTVGHRAILHGCTIGKGALIGMGAIVMNRAEIGEYALVAAGALVPEGASIPPRALALGSPAKVARMLSDAEVERLANTAQGYERRAELYREAGI